MIPCKSLDLSEPVFYLKINEILPTSEELRKIIQYLPTTKHYTKIRDYYYLVER